MSDKSKEMRNRLFNSDKPVEEQVLIQLTIERICEDMADFFTQFYAMLGPGAMVYIPDAKDEDNSMFYLTVDQLIAAQNDLRSADQDGPTEVMQKAIARAEAINPDKEALFIIQDANKMALLHYNKENPIKGPVIA